MAKSAAKRAVLILGVAAAVIALFLFIVQDHVVLQIRSAVSAEDPRHPDYVAALVGSDLSRGNGFEVLTNGDQIFPAMLSAIDSAQRRISFETYIYDTGDVAERFTSALERAAKRGVKVRMVVDSIGAGTMEESHIERLRAAGCQVAQFNTPAWYSLDAVNYRTHRKILVIDGATGFTGGVGVADHWLGNADSKDHWRDTQVLIRGPLVRLMEAVFYENYLEADGVEAPELDDRPAKVDESGPALIVGSSPTGGSSDLKRLYLLSLASAKRSVDIATPYFVPDDSINWSIADAIRRGVKIRIVVEGEITDAMPVKYASRYFYDWLLQQGVELYEYQPTMLHAKVMVVDGIWNMFGSANFDNRSLELNDELNVAVSSRELAGRLLHDFEQDLKASKRLTLEQWRQRSLLEKTREQFWRLFGELF